MDLAVDKPIAALASPAGGAQRGIVRISGDSVRPILTDWFEPDDVAAWDNPQSARAYKGSLRLDDDGLNCRVPVRVLYWPNRRSYTGQPLLELHLPGSPPLLEVILEHVYRRGARAARPGEFTMRAFLAGKLDLLQAEAVLGVIDAEDHRELETALSQLAGGISGSLAQLRRELLELLADLEAGLDFVDEDIEFVSRDEVVKRLGLAESRLQQLLQQASDRMQSRVRSKVVLAGLPNAGKSTLFNRLVGNDAALVSAERGTTRDFLSCPVNWSGLSFDLIDTAGWEDDTSGISGASQIMRHEQLQQSHLLLWCSAAGMGDAERKQDDELFIRVQREFPGAIRLKTKSDLVTGARSGTMTLTELEVSAWTQSGLASLFDELHIRLSAGHEGGDWLGMTAARCRDSLSAASQALQRAVVAARQASIGDELIAVDLRDGLDQLGVVLGVIYTDDILDRIFSKFCIGK